MGVTEVQPYFTQIIGHNSVILYRIPNKLDTEIRFNASFNEPFKCAKFQLDQSMCLYFMVDFAKCVKRRSRRPKEEGRNPRKFGHSYLRNGWDDFLHIWYVDCPTTRVLLLQTWFQLDRRSWSYICVKIKFSLFRSMYSRVLCASFLGRMTHYRVS